MSIFTKSGGITRFYWFVQISIPHYPMSIKFFRLSPLYRKRVCSSLIDECFEWFYDNKSTYDLPRMNNYIPSTLNNETCNFLNTIGKIKQALIIAHNKSLPD